MKKIITFIFQPYFTGVTLFRVVLEKIENGFEPETPNRNLKHLNLYWLLDFNTIAAYVGTVGTTRCN